LYKEIGLAFFVIKPALAEQTKKLMLHAKQPSQTKTVVVGNDKDLALSRARRQGTAGCAL